MEFHNFEIFDDRYLVFRHDRNYRELNCQRGGGVLVAAQKSLEASLILTTHEVQYEDVWIKAKHGNTSLVV